jgi:hypothetical protein
MMLIYQIHKMWSMPKAIENTGVQPVFNGKKISKNCLTRRGHFGIIVELARTKVKV